MKNFFKNLFPKKKTVSLKNNDQEKKCLKLQEDYQKLVQAKGEFDLIFFDIKKDKVTSSNIGQISKKVTEAKIKKQEIKKILEIFTPKIIREIIKNEKKKLSEFFGEEIKVPNPPEEITKERIEQWTKMGFELHYLPKMDMLKKKDLKTWEKNATDLFKYIENGRVDSSAANLTSGWILIDNRRKPDRNHMYECDVFGKIIAELRERRIIADQVRINKNSRFWISWSELNKLETKQAFAKVIGVKPEQIDLPKAIEWNVMGNIYYNQWGKTSCVEWFKDNTIDDNCSLDGGDSEFGGLSSLSCHSRSNTSDGLGFRLLVRFPE